MAKWIFIDWLLYWIIETSHFEFDWDSGNLSKNEDKHNVSTSEAESVFRIGLSLPLGVEESSSGTKEERYGLLGRSFEGKILQIAFAMRNEKIRIISARPANTKERKNYEENIRKIFKDL
ncbi:MAG: BrnT family toxin [Rhizobacter sp.]|nr:BrnT family toxin [Bacteriovorax sp.]